MIPILFSETEQNFTSNGIGRLSEAISCIVTEERNGEYTLSMTYPVSGKWFSELKVSRYIYAVPSDGATAQPFRIYKISKPLNGKVTISAEHRSYQLSHIPCGPFTASNVSGALQGLNNNAYETCGFDFWTNKSTIANYKQTEPASIRSRLGGVQGSILDVYGGEYEFDNLTVKLHANRGTNRGVTLRYGKNITDINQEINIQNTITGVCPFAIDQEQNVITLPERVVYSPNASNFPEPRDAVIDFSSEFENTAPTVEALRAKANAYINANNIGVPSVNIKVSFVALWQTEEYKDIAVLERVKLCDTVTVYFEKLGVEATAKVIKTEYDVLKDRYRSIELGESRTNLSSQIVDLNNEIQQKPSYIDVSNAVDGATAAMEADIATAIANATKLIQGGLGGHVVFTTNANGEPEEILIMDTDNVLTAVNVIRMNQNGIGFSTTGYNGPFTTAWTIDGHFNADYITAGTLKSINIQSVNMTSATIVSSAINNGNGTFSVNSVGTLKASNAEITGKITSTVGLVTATLDSYGLLIESHAGNNYTISARYGGLTVDNPYGDQTAIGAGILSMNRHSGSTLYGGTSINYNRIQTVDGSFSGSLSVSGTKSRISETKDYGKRLLYCYETPTPYFGDIGEGKTDEFGECYIFIDEIFDETVEGKYQVFLQAYGEGALYVSERTASYFVVKGEPNTSFGWELKAPQNGYALDRLEPYEPSEANEDADVLGDIMNYLTSQLYDVEGENYEEY